MFDPEITPLLTRAEVCRLLRIDVSTTFRLIKNGDLPQPIKIGGSFRWRTSDIIQLLAGEPKQQQPA